MAFSCALLCFFLPPPSNYPKSLPLSTFPTGGSYALLGKHKFTGSSLFALCRIHAARSNAADTSERADEEALRAALCASTLPLLEESLGFPWAEWIQEMSGPHPALATQILKSASRVPGLDALSLARLFSRKDVPPGLRIEGHRMMWALNPAEAFQKGRQIIREEKPRAQHQFPGLYVENILLPQKSLEVTTLLEEAAASPTLSSWGRVQAIRELARRSISREIGGLFLTIFLSEERDLTVRKEALLALMAIDPDSGEEILLTRMPSRSVRPILHAFMAELREEHGLPPLPKR